MSRPRNSFSNEFKLKVALEAIKGAQTMSELAVKYKLHPNQISNWKSVLLSNGAEIFKGKRGPKRKENAVEIEELFQQIGKLQYELTWLKKNMNQCLEQKRILVDIEAVGIPVSRQCALLDIPRSSYYFNPRGLSQENLRLMKMIDKIYTKHPFYGSPKITDALQRRGYEYNHKRIARLMRIMGIQAVYPKRNLSRQNHSHRVFPYLLRNMKIERRDHVWSTDITYLPMRHGYAYLTAVIDWFSRYVLSWELSNTLDSYFCIQAVEQALLRSRPEIFNTDQGSQFTSEQFIEAIISRDILLSMDSKGRALDNVFIERLWRSLKYEDIYIREYETMSDLYSGLSSYFQFYNHQRSHQPLGYKTPAEIYFGKGAGR